MDRSIEKTDILPSSSSSGKTVIVIDEDDDIDIKLEPIWSQSYSDSDPDPQDEDEFEIVVENDEEDEDEYLGYEMESESEGERPSTSKELQQNLQEDEEDQETSPVSPESESESSENNNVNSKKRRWMKKCPYCPKMVSSGSSFTYHVNLHKGLKYNCSCNKSFRTSLLLRHHQRDKCQIKHPNIEKAKPIKKDPLKIIKKVKDTSGSSSSSNNKTVWKAKCPICEKIVIKNYLKDHVAKHENIQNYKCIYQNCDFSAFYSAALHKHYKRVHNGNENEDQENQNERNEPFIDLNLNPDSEIQNDPIGDEDDPESEEEMININPNFNIYVESENDEKERSKDENKAGDPQEDSSGSSEEDDDDNVEDSDKEKEIPIKSKKIKNWVKERGRCGICKKEYDKYYLKDHMAKHKNVKNYPCKFPNCNFSSFYSTEISKHYRKTHKNKKLRKNFQENKKECENDNKGDDSDDDEVDSIPKPKMNPQNVNFDPEKKSKGKRSKSRLYWKERVACPICQMKLTRINLKDHLAKHQNIKNYSCQMCEFSSFYRNGLFIHYKNVHKCKNPNVTRRKSFRKTRRNQLEKNKLEIWKTGTTFDGKRKRKRKAGKITPEIAVTQKLREIIKISTKRSKRIYVTKFRRCRICQKKIPANLFQRHALKHKNPNSENQANCCDICTFSSFWLSSLIRHYRDVHKLDYYHKKPIIDQNQKENQENEKNPEIEIPVKNKPQFPVQAQKVEKAGGSGIVKNNKKVKKGNGKHFSCLICRESFTAFDSLKNHLQRHLNEPAPKINKAMDITEEKIAEIMNCFVNCNKCRQVLVQHGKYLEKATEESEFQVETEEINPENSSPEPSSSESASDENENE